LKGAPRLRLANRATIPEPGGAGSGAVVKIDPFSILLTFGAALVVCGLYHRTPFPVKPMKPSGQSLRRRRRKPS